MRRNFRIKGFALLFIIVILLGAAIGIINATGVKLGFVENVVNVVVTPVQKLITSAGNGINDFFGYFSDVDAIKAENKMLKDENAKLKSDLKTAEAHENENETLRSLLGLQKSMDEFDTEAAQVVARDPGNWFNMITVDKGSADGVAVDQAVVTVGNALVGRVYEVGSNCAKIMTIIDPQCSAGALIERSGEYGVTEGDGVLGQEGKFKLSYISKNTNLIVGDTIVTSGLGGIFPEGLSIGKVQSIMTDVQGISQYAVIEPACDFNTLKNVLIIKNNL